MYITVKEGKVLNERDVIQWVKNSSGISKYMVPSEVEVVAELPKTNTGKLRKNVLREWARGNRETG